MSEPATVIIADDHPLFRAALCDSVAKEFPDCSIREAADFNQLQQLVEASPDALLAIVDHGGGWAPQTAPALRSF